MSNFNPATRGQRNVFGGPTSPTGSQTGLPLSQQTPFGGGPGLYGYGKNNLFSHMRGGRPKVRRSGYRDTSSQLTPDDPDPNGDAILVVSSPAQPRKYYRNSSATQYTPGPGPIPGNAGRETRFRVSSKHLALVSAYFEKMFTPQWWEGQELSSNGSIELKIPDTDPDAFLIILNIIHLRRRKIPSSVSLEMLTELAVLTDYFQCHEALEPYPSIWKDNIKKEPAKYDDGLVKWICISWVFYYPDIFSEVTQIAQRQSMSEIDCLDLPIPESVYGE